MVETPPQSLENILTSAQKVEVVTSPFDETKLANSDQILRQIHPIFLTTHAEAPVQKVDTGFEKFLHFLRTLFEGALKLFDILIDAVIQIVKISVWAIAILGVLIITTLVTNTTDKFIDLLNESVFRPMGIDTRIQKVATGATATPVSEPTTPVTAPKATSASSRANDLDAQRAAAIEARKSQALTSQ